MVVGIQAVTHAAPFMIQFFPGNLSSTVIFAVTEIVQTLTGQGAFSVLKNMPDVSFRLPGSVSFVLRQRSGKGSCYR
jgi:hypothetical protein